MNPNEITAISSEAGILASLIYHPDYYFLAEELTPEHFFKSSNRAIFMALEDLILSEVSNLDAYNIKQSINKQKSDGIIIEDVSVDDLQDFIINASCIARNTSEEYQKLVDAIVDCSFRRQMYKALDRCKGMCFDQKVSDIKCAITSEIDATIMEYDNVVSSDSTFAIKIPELWQSIKDRQSTLAAGIRFKCIPALNQYCTIDAEELIVIAAYKKVGKSTLLTNIAMQAMEDGIKCLYIDSEMSDESFFTRLQSYRTGISYKRIKEGNYSQEESLILEREANWLLEHSETFIHENMPVLKPDKISSLVKKWHHKIGLDLFIIDYIKTDGKQHDAFANSQMMGNVVDMCKNSLATKLKIAGIVAAQAKADGSLADSEKIERYASTVLLMSDKTRQEMMKDGPECGSKKLRVKFNRNGESHMDDEFIDLQHDGQRCRIEQAVKQHDPNNYIPASPY